MSLKKQSILSAVLLFASFLIGVGTTFADNVTASGDGRDLSVVTTEGVSINNTSTDVVIIPVGDTVVGEGNGTTHSSGSAINESENLPSENSAESSQESSDTTFSSDNTSTPGATSVEDSLSTGLGDDVSSEANSVSENVPEVSESSSDINNSSTTEYNSASVSESNTVSSSTADKHSSSAAFSDEAVGKQSVLPETGDGISLKKVIFGTITVVVAVYLALGDKIKAFFVDLLADDEEE